jgi:uncharacterized protein
MMELDITWDPAKAQSNLSKHGVSFTRAASVLLDPLALTVFDAAHSDQDERWFTLGLTLDGTLLAIAHTYQSTGPDTATVRLISARAATRREREQYQNEPR